MKAAAPRSVLMVTHSLATGGTDRVAMYLANGFSKYIDTNLTHLLWPSASSPLFEMIDPAVTTCGYFRETRGRAQDMIFSFAKFARSVRREAPDIMVATGNNNAWYTGLAFIFNPNPNRKLFVKITNPVIRARGSAFVNAVRRVGYDRLFRHSAGILALSDGEAQQLADAFPQYAAKIKVVENPYVTNEMLSIGAAREASTEASIKTIIAIGRLHHQKNLPLLLRAWQILNRNDAQLLLVGEGPDKSALEQLTKSLGICGTVQFAGYQANIAPYLRDAHALALSSSYEGLPAVVLEAMAAGCPVVATDCFPAARALVGNAPLCHLTACDDVEGLAKALDAVLSGPRTHPGLALAAKPYQIDVAVKSHMRLLGIHHE